ncbi:MAG: ATP-dependent DNA helicase [Deltaproteobacteria bacterium]|nr:ATP-dependent DNA helicase [Deltaproteobacteria bacterium]
MDEDLAGRPDDATQDDPQEVVRRFFAADGPLADVLGPGFEARPEQLAMAQAVLAALWTDHLALIEAGTGTGKTLAYLVPAALFGGRTVISTFTRHLQDQLATKDVPLVERALGRPLEAIVMKGLGNYLCRRRLDGHLRAAAVPPEHDPRLAALLAWSRETRTGDRAELAWLRDDDPLWREVQSGADVRLGARCPHFDRCFVTQLRRRAARAHLVIVNHHLFFADLAVPEESSSRVLPPWDAAVFDEAHELEDAAAGFFGVRVSSRRVDLFRTDVARRLQSLGVGGRGSDSAARSTTLDRIDEAVRDVARLGERLAELSGGPGDGEGAGRRAPLGEALTAEEIGARYRAADDALERVEHHLRTLGEGDDELALLAQRCANLRGDLAELMEGDDEGHVTWIEPPRAAPAVGLLAGRGRRGRGRRAATAEVRLPPGLVLGRTPLDIAGLLQQRLYARGSPVVFTSATLADHRGFDFVRRRFGMPEDALELRLASPFDFERQALLYVPDDLPEPKDAGYREALLARTKALLELTGGGALLLYTSFRNQRWMAEGLRALGHDDLLVQGEAPRHVLLERLRSERDAVLLATASFWQGVDVAGEALRLVVIDKLPFDVPADPLVRARIERIRREGGNPFGDYQVPVAALALRQGFGRLIRSRRDRGIVAILDVRLHSRRYGRAFLGALPRCTRASTLEQVDGWWREAPLPRDEK